MKRIFSALVTLAGLAVATALTLMSREVSVDAFVSTISVVQKLIEFSIGSAVPIALGLLLVYKSKRAIREHQSAFMSLSLVAGMGFTDWSVGFDSLNGAGMVLATVLYLSTFICLPVTLAEWMSERRNSMWRSRDPAERY
jgi:energy-converting hydrogenase Eha subunit G